MGTKRIPSLLLAMTLTACGGQDAPETATTGETTEPGDVMDGMPGMPEMPRMDTMLGMGTMLSGAMIEEMRYHMEEMQAAGGDWMVAMMPQHEQMVANMIAQFNREIRDMNMSADAEWDTTIDSLRQDLSGMPEMSAPELMELMPEHHGRLMQLMEMHEGLIGSVGM
ncbi:MAG: hypothetical protein GEU90_16280 [Gemmatimonas sp.]|nr:hypothetical protein [Gemmatimonas sp.]